MHKKHEPCKDTTHLGTDDFLKHLQSLPSYANQVHAVFIQQVVCCGAQTTHLSTMKATCRVMLDENLEP